jgi:epoxyqueuosine reductase
MSKTWRLKEALLSKGAAVVGITPAVALPQLRDDILSKEAKGWFGEMHWLARSAGKRTDPSRHLEGAKTVICSAWPYSRHNNRYFARYSLHVDYHDYISERLVEAWRGCGFDGSRARFFIDSKPLAEKAYAARAGIGWIGKNSLIINREIGSFFCLGLIVTDIGLETDRPHEDLCGNCTRCIDSCPTKAIIAPGVIDSKRCISYLTTEHKGEIPADIKPQMGCKIFGCDTCQEVCPYNQEVDHPGAIPKKEFGMASLDRLMSLSQTEFRQKFEGTPIYRIGKERFIRNVTIARSNKS